MAKSINLDEELGISSTADDIPVKEVVILGRTWHILCDVNSYTLAAIGGGDNGKITDFLLSIVVEDEREDFNTALATAHGLTSENLVKLVTRLIEVASERPTEPPSSSSPSAKNRAPGRSSTGGSSSVRVVRSAN